jgi:hypothetical protein
MDDCGGSEMLGHLWFSSLIAQQHAGVVVELGYGAGFLENFGQYLVFAGGNGRAYDKCVPRR